MGNVGKRLPDGVYVSVDAILNGTADITDEQRELFDKTVTKVGFLPTLAFFAFKNRFIRFVQLNDLQDPHPLSLRTRTVNRVGKFAGEIRRSRRVYHRLDLILDQKDPYYPFHKAVADFELETGILPACDAFKRKIGYHKYWVMQVETVMSYEDYWDKIQELQAEYFIVSEE